MTKKRNRVVVITGASSGFGRGAALRFAQNGDHVVLAARRKRLLKEVADECRAHEVEAVVVEADVGNVTDVEEIASKAIDKFGRIDVWVNDAGVGTVGRFDVSPMQEHERVIRTNLLGTMYGAYEALKQFREQGEGVLINVSSFAGKVAPTYLSSYAASKFGVRGLGMALRQELEQKGSAQAGAETYGQAGAQSANGTDRNCGRRLGKLVQADEEWPPSVWRLEQRRKTRGVFARWRQ